MTLYQQRRDLYESKSGLTSEIYWTGDAETINLQSYDTVSLEVQGSDADGRDAAITEADWSELTTLSTSTGIFDIAPGVRWLRTIRTSSAATVRLALKTVL